MSVTCIWQPKFCTNEALVAMEKVPNGKGYLYFAADRNHPNLYSYDGVKVRQECKLVSNGKIFCYCIPMQWLVDEGELSDELKLAREKQYTKFKKKVGKK